MDDKKREKLDEMVREIGNAADTMNTATSLIDELDRALDAAIERANANEKAMRQAVNRADAHTRDLTALQLVTHRICGVLRSHQYVIAEEYALEAEALLPGMFESDLEMH